MEGTAAQPTGGNDFDDQSGDTVTVFNHEGDGENTEHLQSMDLHDVKTALEKDAELDEPGSAGKASPTSTAGSSGLQQSTIRPIIQPMLYANGFMVPPFAGTPIYTAGIRPIKMEGSDWKVSGSSTVVPYGYPTTAGFLPVDQSTLRYPFIMPTGQYAVATTPYQHLTAFGQPAAPNAAVQPNSGLVQPQQVKEKKPHIKKPLNAFMIFMKTKRAEVIKECTLKESAAINQILGKMWHALDRTEQAKYYEMAREERARHMQMYPGWSARDNYAIHKKRRKRKAKNESKDEEEAGCELVEGGAPEKCSIKHPDSPGQWCGLCKGKKRKQSEDSPIKMSEVTVTKTENSNLLPSVPEIEITTTATNQSESSIIQSSAVSLQTISS